MAEKVIPLGHKVLVKQEKASDTYGDSGIYIPESQQSQAHKAIVVSIGELVQGVQEENCVQYSANATPVNMMHNGEKHLLIDQHDILAIIVNV